MVRKPGRHSERPEPGRRRAWFVVTALGLIAAARTVGLALLRDEGVLHWIVWAHPLPAHRAWVPFIHSPAFSEYVYQIDALARRYELPPEHFVIWLMALLQPAIVWAAYVAASGHGRRRRGMHAALLVTLAPTMLRPFEQYPLAILLVGAALAATAVYHRRGGPIAWAFALVLGFAATFFHLSVWFLLLPWWCLLARRPERGRGFAVIALACLGGTWWTMQPGVFGEGLAYVLKEPSVASRDIFSPRGFVNLTLECANPALYLALLVGWLSTRGDARTEEATGRPLAAAVACYVLVTAFLQYHGFAINTGGEYGWHHYFELTEVAAVVAVLTMAGRGRLGQRWLLQALLVTQLLAIVRVLVVLVWFPPDASQASRLVHFCLLSV